MGGVRAWLHGGADHRGFSLVELLVGIALLGLVALSFYTVHQRTQQSLFGGEQRADMQQNARAAMQAVVAELRAASLVTGTHPDEVVFTSDRYVTGQERRFLLDVDDHDGDGDTSELLLSRSPGDDGSPGPVIDEVAEGISGLSFRYLGDGIGSGSGDEVSEPLAVRRIEVTLEAETLPDGQAGRRTLALTSQVRPRNLGLPLPPATDSLPPAPPTGFAGAATCGTVVLHWHKNVEADVVGYRVHYDTDAPGEPYAGTGAHQGRSPIYVGGDTTYVLTGLDTGMTYYLALTARDAQGLESGYSTGLALQPHDANAPARVTGLAARLLSETAVELSWSAVPDLDLAWYRIHYDVDAPGAPYAHQDSCKGVSHAVTGLTPGVRHYFAVSAVDACGNEGSLSSDIVVTPTRCEDDEDPPATPTGFTGYAGDGSARFAWDASGEIDLAHYELRYHGPDGYGHLDVGRETSFTVDGLENGSTYEFGLSAADVCENESPAAGPIYVTPVSCGGDSTSPSSPRGVTVVEDESPGGDQLTLSWTANHESDLAGYLVYVEGPGGWSDTLNTGLEIFTTITGLIERETYYMAVAAYDRCQNLSSLSAEVVGVPRAPCTCPPSVSVETPAPGSTVSGMVLLSATAAACSTALREVVFTFDRVEIGRFYAEPYWTWFSTLGVDDGDYIFKVKATDILDCQGSDSVAVTVDNSGSLPPCVQTDPASPYVLEGTYHQTVALTLEATDPVIPFEMMGTAFQWDEPPARLHQVEIPAGTVAWDAGGDLASAVPSGALVTLSPHPTVSPGSPVTMKLHFWNSRGDTVTGGRENMPLDDAVLVGTYVGETGHACGPDTLSSRCLIQVTDLHASTGNSYQTAWLDEGDPYYTDNTIPRLSDIPDGGVEGGFEQLLWIKTFSGDAARGSGFQLNFTVDRPVTVYVGYDQRYVPPTWIRNNYTQVGANIGVTDSAGSFKLWKKDFSAGNVQLKGNYGTGIGSGATRMYLVLLRCR